jgi:hypothetical protein
MQTFRGHQLGLYEGEGVSKGTKVKEQRQERQGRETRQREARQREARQR